MYVYLCVCLHSKVGFSWQFRTPRFCQSFGYSSVALSAVTTAPMRLGDWNDQDTVVQRLSKLSSRLTLGGYLEEQMIFIPCLEEVELSFLTC